MKNTELISNIDINSKPIVINLAINKYDGVLVRFFTIGNEGNPETTSEEFALERAQTIKDEFFNVTDKVQLEAAKSLPTNINNVEIPALGRDAMQPTRVNYNFLVRIFEISSKSTS